MSRSAAASTRTEVAPDYAAIFSLISWMLERNHHRFFSLKKGACSVRILRSGGLKEPLTEIFTYPFCTNFSMATRIKTGGSKAASPSPPGGKPKKKWVKNATKIGWDEIPKGDRWTDHGSNCRRPNKHDYYKHLDQLNQGWREGEKWTDSVPMTKKSNDWIINSVACQVNLTKSERTRAVKAFMGINLGEMGVLKEQVAVALCAYMVEKDQHDQRRGHPQAARAKEGGFPDFSELAEMFNVDQKQTARIYYRLEQRYG